MGKATALIVDDEPDIRQLIEITLGRMDIQTRGAANVEEAYQHLSEQNFDLCLTDMKLPDGDGLDIVEHIQSHFPQLPIAVITAHGNVETAVSALKSGAFDFVSKPIDLKILRNLIETALRLPEKDSTDTNISERLITHSPGMQSLHAMIKKVARSQAPVHISGESGVGKELVARMIHELGPRSDKAFVPVNCGAIPGELMESEFFGHQKGSFTGANEHKEGLFQAAEGGTLFLDEVADLPLSMQVKLLRAIQEKAVKPVGGQHEIPVDVRILSATHKDLVALVEENQFRQDLYYRINVIELRVPALRERPEDIQPIAESLLVKICQANHIDGVKLSNEALEQVCHYQFPGNVRELENILERAVALCEDGQIAVEDLQLQTMAEIPEENSQSRSNCSDASLESYLDSVEKDAIMKALEETRWNKTAAAKKLGITFRALRYRLKKLGLD